jgi:hypothetical protein
MVSTDLTQLSPLQALALRTTGLTLEDLTKASAPEPSSSRHDSVPMGPEMARILRLPSRPNPASDSDAQATADFLTSRLARTSTPYPGPLRALQGSSLKEIWTRRAGWLPVPVGHGKTIICFLSASLLGSARPLYVAPAGLLKQAKEEFRRYYRDWQGVHPDAWTYLSYETLSREGAGIQYDTDRKVIRAALLDRINPTSVCCDEAHRMRATGTSTSRRFKAFRKSHPDTPLLFLTGSPGNEVVHLAHLLAWCLGPANSPLPSDFHEKMAWQAATSSKGAMGPPTDIGALVELFTDDERARAAGAEDDDKKAIARAAIGRRIRTTPGVVGVEGGELEIPLSIDAVEPTNLDPAIDAAMAQLRTLWATPDGDIITDATAMAAKTAQVGRGYFTRWAEPKPPPYWLEPRKAQRSWVRDVINHNRLGLDSQEAVEKAVMRGVLNDFGLLEMRKAAEARYFEETGLKEPLVEEVVISSEPIDFAVEWVKKHPASIVWAYNRGFAQRLAVALNTSCYQEEGLDANGRYIGDHPHNTPMVASYPANHVGKNLQHGHHQNLWFHSPNEQALGRTHRPGQKRDVLNHVYVATREHASAFWNRMREAQEAFEMSGAAQRLLYALNSVPEMRHWEERPGPRWRK